MMGFDDASQNITFNVFDTLTYFDDTAERQQVERRE
jgi:hypothetical protein